MLARVKVRCVCCIASFPKFHGKPVYNYLMDFGHKQAKASVTNHFRLVADYTVFQKKFTLLFSP